MGEPLTPPSGHGPRRGGWAVPLDAARACGAPCAAAARVVPLTPLTLALGVMLVAALAAWGVRRAVR